MSRFLSRYAYPLAALALMVASAASCNHTPLGRLDKTLTLRVQQGAGTGEAIKVDFLWVVDNSSSMCQEQVSLARNFQAFTDQLAQYFALDSRLAVTTVDAQCEVDGTSTFSAKGTFNTHVNRTFPAACQEERKLECKTDVDCAGLDCELFPEVCDPGAQGEWGCDRQGVAGNSNECWVTPNGSLNTSCRRRCTTDLECQTLFGDPTFYCQKPSANQEDWGCVRPPDTGSCPDALPEFLEKNATTDNIALFPCLASVGVSQAKCLRYEQPLKSALLALDPTGPNHEQVARFVRPDAYLVIVFITDEEDCSADANANPPINEQQFHTCGLLKTTDQGGPLTPVAHFVNRFKSLKRDPSKVIVAAIAGDSTAVGSDGQPDPVKVAFEREQYLAAKGGARVCFSNSYICQSANGIADYGARMIELTKSFGPNGTFGNICADEGIGPALSSIAATIVRVINKVCLPKEIVGALKVERTSADGTVDVLTEGDGPGKYRVIPNAEDCAGEAGNLLPAIAFGDPPNQGETIQVTYQGDPGLIE